MQKKSTLRGLYLRTGVLMLVLSLLIGLILIAVMLALFAARDPRGRSFVQSMTDLLKQEFEKKMQGARQQIALMQAKLRILNEAEKAEKEESTKDAE